MEIDPKGIAKNKIWIIFILNVLKFRLKEDQLAEICDRFSLMGCFDFSMAINELKNTDLVKCEETPLGNMYSMSMLGESTLEFFVKELSYTKRQEVLAALKKDSDEIYLKSIIGYDVMRLKDGRCRVLLRMIEKDLEVFDITLIANNPKEADMLTQSWMKKAQRVYEAVYITLGDGEEK